MNNFIKTKKGLNISIKGTPSEIIGNVSLSNQFALIPDDFHGITPKLEVKEGDSVNVGSPIFHDKNIPELKFVSPVSGKITSINRGERRKILSISVKSDGKQTPVAFSVPKLNTVSAEKIKSLLLEAGLFTFIKQRPYDVIANPTITPKAIFISAYDTAPLAPNYEYILSGQGKDFQTGIDVLSHLTSGKVYVGVKANSVSKELSGLKNAEIIYLQGPHPIGNVGIQIHHIYPINKGENVWTVNAQDVLYFGRLFNTGSLDFNKIIALTGPEVIAPQYYKTILGSQITSFINENVIKKRHLRYISGNVLTGTKIEVDGYIGAYDSQITVIEEGDERHDLVGWAMPRLNKFSMSRTYFSWLTKYLLPKKSYQFDARILGGERAFIMSGEYDKVVPMDILPEFLVKAMITKNIDKMEQLGIYEIAPEDLALCEFVCTSKIEVQKITRQALDMLKKELG